MILNPQNCGSREDTLPCCLQNDSWWVRLPPLAGAAMLHPLFQLISTHKLVDATDDVVTLVGHLGVEVDVGNT